MPSTISLGSTGDDVKRLQRALARQLLWNPFGPITGVFDASLQTSVKLIFYSWKGQVIDIASRGVLRRGRGTTLRALAVNQAFAI